MKQKKICVYAICKNESQFISRWLDSMQEADYIVVLDTGSTDNSVERLKADPRVTKVNQKTIDPWRFDVARNESMKLIPKDADILVCTDFDEVFEPGWAEIVRQFWKAGTTRMYYTYAWSHNAVNEPTDVFTYDKIHTRDYHWVYPVHEVLMPISDTFQEKVVHLGTHVYLHHYQDVSKSRSSYFDLLKLSVEENPGDSHVQMLLAREYSIKGDYNQAIEEYLKVLKMPDVNEPIKRKVLLNSLLQTAIMYERVNNYDETIWYCQEFIKEDPTYREPYLVMAEIYNSMRMYTLAEAMVNAALANGVRKGDWVELSDSYLGWPDDIMSIAAFHLGKIDIALKCVNEALKHNPNDLRLLKNSKGYLETKINNLEK